MFRRVWANYLQLDWMVIRFHVSRKILIRNPLVHQFIVIVQLKHFAQWKVSEAQWKVSDDEPRAVSIGA